MICSFEPGEIDFEQAVIFDPGGEDVLAFRRCPRCGRYLRISGDAVCIFNGLGDVIRFEGISCSRCGAIEPLWTRVA